MKVQLTKEEIAEMMASRFAIDGAQARADKFINEINLFISQHKAKLEKIGAQVQERVEGCPETGIDLWDFSGINPVNYEGTVEVLESEAESEDDVDPEDDTNFGDKDIEPEDK